MKHFCLVAVISALFSGCVVQTEPDHHHHHDRVHVEVRPVVEGKIEVE